MSPSSLAKLKAWECLGSRSKSGFMALVPRLQDLTKSWMLMRAVIRAKAPTDMTVPAGKNVSWG